MRHNFSFTLEGRDWSRLYLWYWVPTLALTALSVVRSTRDVAAQPEALMGNLLLSLATGFLSMLLQSFFTVPILKTWVPRTSVGGKAFDFQGETNDYLLLNVKGFLLSVATLGIYLPWYARDVLDYLARGTTFNGASARFAGRPGRLLGAFLGFMAGALLVTVLVAVGLAFLLYRPNSGAGVGATGSAALAMTTVTFVLVILIVGPLLYLMYGWMVQFTWNGSRIYWKTKFLQASGAILVQTALTVVTLGLWWPCAALILYRYFTARTLVEHPDGTGVRFSFDGNLTEGFKLLWGQTLLTLVTLGFAGAWTGPRVTRWLAEHTWAEDLSLS